MKMRVWIVEILSEAYLKKPCKWIPTVGCALTKENGIEVLREWRDKSSFRCRLRKYTAHEGG